MLHLVIGAPRSGKSEYAERLIAGFKGPTVYIGTLPVNPYYVDTIRIHRERRPAHWGVIELIGDPPDDLCLISDALRLYQNALLDGLIFYLLRLLTIFDEDMAGVWDQALALISQASNQGKVVIVDPPVPEGLSLRERKVLRIEQLLLISAASTITLVTDGRARSLSTDQALRLNHLHRYSKVIDVSSTKKRPGA